MSDIENVTLTPNCSVATMTWRFKGKSYAGVVVKAAFAITPGAELSRPTAAQLIEEAIHRGQTPFSSVLTPPDVIPYRSSTNILIQGTAYAHQKARIRPRLRVKNREGLLQVDKSIEVVGPGDPDPQPFTSLDLAWEHAVRDDDNPHGVTEQAPRILDVRDPARSAGLGPLCPHARARRQHQPHGAPADFTESLVQLRPDLDWRFYDVAPIDQRMPFARGGEWCVLDHLHQTHEVLSFQLPDRGVQAFAALYLPRGAPARPVAMVLDTILIQPDEMTAELVWRGHAQFGEATDLGHCRFAAALQRLSPTWPSRAELDTRLERPPTSRNRASSTEDSPSTAPPSDLFTTQPEAVTPLIGDATPFKPSASAGLPLTADLSREPSRRRASTGGTVAGLAAVEPPGAKLPWEGKGVEIPDAWRDASPIGGTLAGISPASPAPAHPFEAKAGRETEVGPTPPPPVAPPPPEDIPPTPPPPVAATPSPPPESPPPSEPEDTSGSVRIVSAENQDAPLEVEAAEPTELREGRSEAERQRPKNKVELPPPRPQVHDMVSEIYGKFS